MPWKLHRPGKRGPCWYLRGTDASGRFEVSTGKTARADAEKWADDYLVKRAGERVPGAGETVGFRTAAAFYKAATPHLSKQDIRKVDAVAAAIGDTDCRLVTHSHLVAAANTLKPRCADSTKNRWVIGPAAAVLHYAAGNDWCAYRRIAKFWVSRKSNRKPATDADMAKLMAHLEDPLEEMAPQWNGVDPNLAYKRLLLAMLYETGLRLGHLLSVTWSTVDLQAGRIGVAIPKSDERALVPISPVIVALLASLPPEEKRGRLFPWSTNRGVYAWLDRVRRRAKVHYTPHLSRHALATAAQDVPDKKAAELGVWQDARSLHRYQHVKPDALPGRDAGFLMRVKEKA